MRNVKAEVFLNDLSFLDEPQKGKDALLVFTKEYVNQCSILSGIRLFDTLAEKGVRNLDIRLWGLNEDSKTRKRVRKWFLAIAEKSPVGLVLSPSCIALILGMKVSEGKLSNEQPRDYVKDFLISQFDYFIAKYQVSDSEIDKVIKGETSEIGDEAKLLVQHSRLVSDKVSYVMEHFHRDLSPEELWKLDKIWAEKHPNE